VRLLAVLSRLAEIRDSTRSAIGSCEGTLELGNALGVCPARIEFKVDLPLEGWLALAPSGVEEFVREDPFEVPFEGILITSYKLVG
jgi:hypothetical protein